MQTQGDLVEHVEKLDILEAKIELVEMSIHMRLDVQDEHDDGLENIRPALDSW